MSFGMSTSIAEIGIRHADPVVEPSLTGPEPPAETTIQNAVVELRRTWSGQWPHGERFELSQRHYWLSSCNSHSLSTGSVWVVSAEEIRDGQSSFGDCAFAHWAHSKDEPRFRALGLEFDHRRKMSEDDWRALLVPLEQLAIAAIGADAPHCVGRLDQSGPWGSLRPCMERFVDASDRIRAILEDIWSDAPVLYQLARTDSGEVLVWRVTLSLLVTGELTLEPQSIERVACSDLPRQYLDGFRAVCANR